MGGECSLSRLPFSPLPLDSPLKELTKFFVNTQGPTGLQGDEGEDGPVGPKVSSLQKEITLCVVRFGARY